MKGFPQFIIAALCCMLLSACATDNPAQAPTVNPNYHPLNNQSGQGATSAATMISPVTSYF